MALPREYPPHLVDLLAQFVRDVATDRDSRFYDEARALVAKLDPDRTLVDGVIDDLFPEAAEQNGWAMRRVALECLRRARYLPHPKENDRG